MANLDDMDVKRLVAQAVAPLHKRIAELEAVVARLKRNSSNSSKPPSSDITTPPAAAFEQLERIMNDPCHVLSGFRQRSVTKGTLGNIHARTAAREK